MTVVTAHQPNYLPGLSVVEKVRSSDMVIWLDEVQYSHGGWTNRNRMPDGSWLTVPVERSTDMAAMNRVRISEHGNWRAKHRRALDLHYGDPDGRSFYPSVVDAIRAEVSRPYRLLVGLNLACLRAILDGCDTAWHFQSHLDGGHAAVAVSDDVVDLRPISARIAAMVAELGGTTYLSGPSGRDYLDERPFRERGIAVEYFRWDGPNPCALERVATRRAAA